MATTINSPLIMQTLEKELRKVLDGKVKEIISSYEKELGDKIKGAILNGVIQYDINIEQFRQDYLMENNVNLNVRILDNNEDLK